MSHHGFKPRRLLRVLAVALASLAALMAVTPAAQAYENVQFESIKYRGYCLDSNAAGDVYMNPCNGNNNYQRWLMTWTGTRSYDGHEQVRLRNAATLRYLMQWRVGYPALQTGPLGGVNSNRAVVDGVGTSWSDVRLRASHFDSTAGQGDLCAHAIQPSVAVSFNCNNTDEQRWQKR
ncbi:hypothetical protein PV646_41300 [Streptomyces sp. ID05-26A]|nr:hypothetical protein [Streptomyces sp. ID05-26A]